MSDATAGTLSADPDPDVPALMQRCRGRVLEREGIAMFVALHDARSIPRNRAVSGSTALEGERLAALFDHYRLGLAGLAPTREEEHDPTGAAALIDVLVCLSDAHLRAGTEH